MLCGFGLTEPEHGSDATWLSTRAMRDGDDWVINGRKRFNTGMHRAHYDLVFARTSGVPGAHRGITAFLVPTATPGLEVLYQHWTFNMPSDHAEVALTDVRVPADSSRRADPGPIPLIGDDGLPRVGAGEPLSLDDVTPAQGADAARPWTRGLRG